MYIYVYKHFKIKNSFHNFMRGYVIGLRKSRAHYILK